VHKIDCEALIKACGILPWNYSYEVPKTIDKILTTKNSETMKVSLQFPEGLLLHSTLIADIITKFADVHCLILGDVTYGACCVDDIASKQLGCDFIVHYGHSCLVAIPDLVIPNALYVFVEIKFDVDLFIESVVANFGDRKDKTFLLLGIIQFNSSLCLARAMLEKAGFKVALPQVKPRSKGEVLGCTSPNLTETTKEGDLCIFVGDGRFHIESTMIKNGHLIFYQFNPYTQQFTLESYDTPRMQGLRLAEVEKAKSAKLFGIILGTLGR
jgi:2-(3-amino-3-carboxypropyl)histidine synthase